MGDTNIIILKFCFEKEYVVILGHHQIKNYERHVQIQIQMYVEGQ